MITAEMIKSEVEQLRNYVSRDFFSVIVAKTMIDEIQSMISLYNKQIDKEMKPKQLENIDIE